jgi:hypothetical protein
METTTSARALTADYAAFSITDPGIGIVLVVELMFSDVRVIAKGFYGSWAKYHSSSVILDGIVKRCVCLFEDPDEPTSESFYVHGGRVRFDLIGSIDASSDIEEDCRISKAVREAKSFAKIIRDRKTIEMNNLLPLA